MERGDDIKSLREWAPLTYLLDTIPTKIQRGLFYHDLNVTCIGALPQFLAIGTGNGIVFWYNRNTGHIQKLRCETTEAVTSVHVVSSVEYMVAAGCADGQINIFQIQKEHPPDLNLPASMTKRKPIERYGVNGLHKSKITAMEWSKNGMKLFSGDKTGIIVLTEFDFPAHICRSSPIINEAYETVQIVFSQPWLLVSTRYRVIICTRKEDNNWQVKQIGRKDRRQLSDFGATFRGPNNRQPTILCSRPGFRLWMSDSEGNVSQTLLFKEAVAKQSFQVQLLNPVRGPVKTPTNFGRLHLYRDNYMLTYADNILYILNLETMRLETAIKNLRQIQNISICGREIFIVEGPRSIIRISTQPEEYSRIAQSRILYNPLHTSATLLPMSSIARPIEFEADEDVIVRAEECFELPPFQVQIDMPSGEHNFVGRDKMILEHCKKVEVYEKINEMEYDESILYKGGTKKKRKSKGAVPKVPSAAPVSGIVEIGQQATCMVEPIMASTSQSITDMDSLHGIEEQLKYDIFGPETESDSKAQRVIEQQLHDAQLESPKKNMNNKTNSTAENGLKKIERLMFSAQLNDFPLSLSADEDTWKKHSGEVGQKEDQAIQTDLPNYDVPNRPAHYVDFDTACKPLSNDILDNLELSFNHSNSSEDNEHFKDVAEHGFNKFVEECSMRQEMMLSKLENEDLQQELQDAVIKKIIKPDLLDVSFCDSANHIIANSDSSSTDVFRELKKLLDSPTMKKTMNTDTVDANTVEKSDDGSSENAQRMIMSDSGPSCSASDAETLPMSKSLHQIPDYNNLPKLWNIKRLEVEPEVDVTTQRTDSGDWELVNTE